MRKRIAPSLLPVIFGCSLAVLAIGAEAFLGLAPPNSYGLCLICHTMDSINWMLNKVLHLRLPVQPVSVSFPLITSFAVLAGAFLAAKTSKEVKIKSVSNVGWKFCLGFAVMTSALVAMGCPIRLTLLLTYGDGMALFSFAGLILGIVAGSYVLKWRSTA